MGRRSLHSPSELRELILGSARAIIEKDGLAALSARTVARQIGYSPGTLYNVFHNLDDLILHVEARLLDELEARLSDRTRDATASDKLKILAHTYLAFTSERPRLWNLLFEHHLPKGVEVPEWYRVELDRLLAHVEDALIARLGADQAETARRAARVLWAGVHGISSLATADKLSTVTTATAGSMVDDLVESYMRGLKAP